MTFCDLSPRAADDLREYVRHEKLIVSAVAEWSAELRTAAVKQFGQRLVMKEFAKYFQAAGSAGVKAADLRGIYAECRARYDELPRVNSMDDMAAALRAFEEAHRDLCEPLPSQDQFYGWTKGSNRLKAHVEWVYIPAVKDAAAERVEAKKSALGLLLEKTVRAKTSFDAAFADLKADAEGRYKAIVEGQREHLDALAATLGEKFQAWTNRGTKLRLEWQADPTGQVQLAQPVARVVAGENGFEGDLARMGHGTQRCFILALLQELSGSDTTSGPTLILGCEEPELFQHPPQARHLASVLQRLSDKNAQVIVSTHSPLFITGNSFEDVRAVRKDTVTQAACVRAMTLDDLAASLNAVRTGGKDPDPVGTVHFQLHMALQPHISELFFTSLVVLVEGLEDVAYIASYLKLLGIWDRFRQAGCHIVAANGKSAMLQPLAIARHFRIPTFVVFDSDGHCKEKNRDWHRNDNARILGVCGVDAPEFPPVETLWRSHCVMWRTEMGEVVQSELGGEWWKNTEFKVKKEHDAVQGSLNKNAMFIGHMFEHAWQHGLKSESLSKLCHAILTYAGSVNSEGIFHSRPTTPPATAGGEA